MTDLRKLIIGGIEREKPADLTLAYGLLNNTATQFCLSWGE